MIYSELRSPAARMATVGKLSLKCSCFQKFPIIEIKGSICLFNT